MGANWIYPSKRTLTRLDCLGFSKLSIERNLNLLSSKNKYTKLFNYNWRVFWKKKKMIRGLWTIRPSTDTREQAPGTNQKWSLTCLHNGAGHGSLFREQWIHKGTATSFRELIPLMSNQFKFAPDEFQGPKFGPYDIIFWRKWVHVVHMTEQYPRT